MSRPESCAGPAGARPAGVIAGEPRSRPQPVGLLRFLHEQVGQRCCSSLGCLRQGRCRLFSFLRLPGISQSREGREDQLPLSNC